MTRACGGRGSTQRGLGYLRHVSHFQALRPDHASAVLAFELGRFNLYDIKDGTAEVGYRVAKRVAGRGVATAGVGELCRLAVSEHGVRRLRARTTHENEASQRVLAKAGFVADGEADVEGRPGIVFERLLKDER